MPELLEQRAPAGHFPRLDKLVLLVAVDGPWVFCFLICIACCPVFFTKPSGGILRESKRKPRKGGEEGWFLVTESTPALGRARFELLRNISVPLIISPPSTFTEQKIGWENRKGCRRGFQT